MNEELYEPGDVYTDPQGVKWLRLTCGRWAMIYDIPEPDKPITVTRKGEIH